LPYQYITQPFYAHYRIAGGTGSGKTTVVHQIMNELPDTEVGIISQDSYYKENHNLSFDERALLNFDHPRAIDCVAGSPSKRA
jgi:uridine kinase